MRRSPYIALTRSSGCKLSIARRESSVADSICGASAFLYLRGDLAPVSVCSSGPFLRILFAAKGPARCEFDVWVRLVACSSGAAVLLPTGQTGPGPPAPDHRGGSSPMRRGRQISHTPDISRSAYPTGFAPTKHRREGSPLNSRDPHRTAPAAAPPTNLAPQRRSSEQAAHAYFERGVPGCTRAISGIKKQSVFTGRILALA